MVNPVRPGESSEYWYLIHIQYGYVRGLEESVFHRIIYTCKLIHAPFVGHSWILIASKLELAKLFFCLVILLTSLYDSDA